jgi:rare lipoprotein A (peptidoglycan hydrolase)
MNRLARATTLIGVLSLAGCASETLPTPEMLQPSEISPQTSSDKPFFTEKSQKPFFTKRGQKPFFTERGLASFYGAAQNGNTTADGDTFRQSGFTAAHRKLAFGTVVRVTNTENGRSVKVSINDRGPHVKERIIDLSDAAARALGMKKEGVAQVKLEAFQGDQRPG